MNTRRIEEATIEADPTVPIIRIKRDFHGTPAQLMAAHESPRTTKLYDRTNDAVSLDEVERVVF